MKTILGFIVIALIAALIGFLVFIIFIPPTIILSHYLEFMAEKIGAYFEKKREQKKGA